MRKKWGIRLKAFILLLDEILIAGGVIFVLWKLGVPIPFWVYILAGVACAAAYWLLYRIVLDQGKKSPVGHDGMIGLTGTTITSLNPEGLVRVQGETWKAASRCGVVVEEAEVLIEDLQGLTLIVKTHHEFE
ncbi:MAG: NfeD family protein [Promethearchaeati archaeon]